MCRFSGILDSMYSLDAGHNYLNDNWWYIRTLIRTLMSVLPLFRQIQMENKRIELGRQKEEKEKLDQKLKELESQLLVGGDRIYNHASEKEKALIVAELQNKMINMCNQIGINISDEIDKNTKYLIMNEVKITEKLILALINSCVVANSSFVEKIHLSALDEQRKIKSDRFMIC
ncbi:hypothetical protein ROZALSC1DRAFT_25979 [Rozella allomycis CSF55]|uniref:Uncharacterized protein n=1 Tax=Rozella allomycis (strain CSF55) TaxID=988480 RepID=A0A4P9Y9V3_ROZAC|nr:hypothetical protein ROZALSC1DRAFT_25979 [Rozella allomycis CSF55]